MPVARACGAFALLLGLVILTGWAIDAQLLVSIAPSLPAASLLRRHSAREVLHVVDGGVPAYIEGR